MKQKMLIIDGHSLAYRAFHALKRQGFKTSEGLPTSAVYGVVMMVLKLVDDAQPDYFVVAEDLGKTFRHEAYEDYKATRKPMDDEFRLQLPYIKKFYEILGAQVVGLKGFEADDVIGTMAHQAKEQGIEVYIVTGDKDSFQLIEDGVSVYYTRRGITDLVKVDRDYVQKKYGLVPEQWRDFKALKGDAADNIPGVPGIGEKTATSLLQKFNNLEEIYNHLEEVTPPRIQNLLAEHAVQVGKYIELTTILRELNLPVCPDECQWKKPAPEELAAFFKELEFKSLLKKILPQAVEEEKVRVEVGENVLPEVKIIQGDELPTFLEGSLNHPVAFQFLAVEATWQAAKVLGASFSLSQDQHGFLPLTQEAVSFPEPLHRWLLDPKAKKICHDVKTHMLLANKYNSEFNGCDFDTLIASYLISGGKNGVKLEEVAKTLLRLEIPELLDEKKKRKAVFSLPADWPAEEMATAGAWRTGALLRLFTVLKERIETEGIEELFYQVEMPLVKILFTMEKQGITVCPELLTNLKEEYAQRINRLEQEIYQLAGEEFNISSPKQLGVILFERLGLPVSKKTKTGYSTDAEVLDGLLTQHPIISKVLDYRGLVKLNSTYVESLLNLAQPSDYKIHTTFHQAVTATGRLSSTDPNLQNIPVRTEEGREIRRCFVPGDQEMLLLSADYSQIELRIMAHLSEDEKLIAAFMAEEDIHQRTAAEIFDLPAERVTSEMRNQAKAVNFGIIYGISGFGLAKGIGVSRQEAEAFIKAYFLKYKGVKSYLEDSITKAREVGYVSTIMNRRRYLPDLTSRNFQRRSFAERMARNTPIQGSAADLIKLAMVRVDERLQKERIPANLLLQVHDELILEVEREAIKEAGEVLQAEMENAFSLKVPLRVEITTGENWGDLV
jgi:DNA polymerase-1